MPSAGYAREQAQLIGTRDQVLSEVRLLTGPIAAEVPHIGCVGPVPPRSAEPGIGLLQDRVTGELGHEA